MRLATVLLNEGDQIGRISHVWADLTTSRRMHMTDMLAADHQGWTRLEAGKATPNGTTGAGRTSFRAIETASLLLSAGPDSGGKLLGMLTDLLRAIHRDTLDFSDGTRRDFRGAVAAAIAGVHATEAGDFTSGHAALVEAARQYLAASRRAADPDTIRREIAAELGSEPVDR